MIGWSYNVSKHLFESEQFNEKKYKKSHLPRPTLQTFVNVQNEMWANIDTK